MTLNAEFTFTAEFQIVGEIRTHGGMTMDTGHGLAGAGIKGIPTERMGKFPLGCMTADAYLFAVTAQHADVLRTVNIMAFGAKGRHRMFVEFVFEKVDRILVTFQADFFRNPLHQAFVIAAMGGMT